MNVAKTVSTIANNCFITNVPVCEQSPNIKLLVGALIILNNISLQELVNHYIFHIDISSATYMIIFISLSIIIVMFPMT